MKCFPFSPTFLQLANLTSARLRLSSSLHDFPMLWVEKSHHSQDALSLRT